MAKRKAETATVDGVTAILKLPLAPVTEVMPITEHPGAVALTAARNAADLACLFMASGEPNAAGEKAIPN